MRPSLRLLRPLRQRALAIVLAAGPATGCTLLIDDALSGKGGSGGSPSGVGGHGGGTASSASGTSAGVGSTSTGATGGTTAGSSTASSSTGSAGGGGSGATGSSSNATSSSTGSGPTCDAGCSLPHATGACSMGACVIVSCAPNYADCDLMPADGCEASLKNDDLHCGSCSNACTAGTTCKGSSCK